MPSRPPKTSPTAPVTASASAATTAPAPAPALTGLHSIVAPPPPLDSIPKPPQGYKPGSLRPYRGYRPTASEVRLAKKAEENLRAFTDSAQRLGSAAPSPLLAARCLGVAMEWRRLRDAAVALEEYTRERDAMAWRDALRATEDFKSFFLPMAARDPKLKDAYPALVAFLAVGKDTGKLVSKTKKRKAKEKRQATKAATEKAIADAAKLTASVEAPPKGSVIVNA